MLLLNKYPYLIILAIGVAIGFYFCSLFNGCGRSSAPVPTIAVEKPEKIQKQVSAVTATYQAKIDSLGQISKQLQSSLQTTQFALDKAKRNNATLQTQVYDLLDRTASQPVDTFKILDCDTLQAKIKDLIASDNEKDSLYQVQTDNLQDQIRNKDSTIAVQQGEYQELKATFTRTLQQQDELISMNKHLEKSVRHQKFKGTLKTIGLTIVAVLATHYLIHQ